MQTLYEMRERDLRDGCVHIIETCELGARCVRQPTYQVIYTAANSYIARKCHTDWSTPWGEGRARAHSELYATR